MLKLGETSETTFGASPLLPIRIPEAKTQESVLVFKSPSDFIRSSKWKSVKHCPSHHPLQTES